MQIGLSALMIQRGQTGISQYLFALLRGLQKFGRHHQFTLFVLEHDLPLFDFLDKSMTVVPVSEEFRSPIKNILWHQKCLPGLTRQRHLQVLHVPSYRRLLWRRPCRLVATIHDLAPFRVPDKYDWKRMLYGRVVVRWLARRQHRIIAVSHNTASDIARFFRLPKDRVQVIHNGVDHERFNPGSSHDAKAWAAEKFGIHRPFFLYVARLEHPAKNHVRLIAAFDRFKTDTGANWQLVFGGSDWHGAATIHDTIKRSPHCCDITALGFIGEADLPELYRAADAFVYPSLYEGFGMPPTEAMACGCPVISSSCGSLAEVIGTAALEADPQNVCQIADALSRLAMEPLLRQQLRTAGIQQARRFDWNRTASETLSVYETVSPQSASADFIRGCQPAVRY